MSRYESPYTLTIANLLGRRSDARADAIRRSGAMSAQAWGNVGQAIGNTVGQISKQMQDAPILAQHAEMGRLQLADAKAAADQRTNGQAQDQAFAQLMQGETPPSPQDILQIYGPERGAKIAQGLAAFSELQTKQVRDARDNAGRLAMGVKALSPEMQQQLWPAIRSAAIRGGLGDEKTIPEQPAADFLDAVIGWGTGKGPETPKTREIKTRNADGTESIQIVEDKPGFTATSTPPPDKVTFGQPQPAMVGGKRVLIRAGSDGSIQTVQGVTPDVPPTSNDGEPLVAIMGKEGKPVLVRRSQAEGQTPASTREQGRPVTSGDAGRMADLDTSLNDLATLKQQLGTTGASSKVGAMLPNVVTEFTGWGADAKSRQAMIDRVKQVIGKALEGGVLRKEDEIKYEKILPTIGDPPTVAKTKLEGLAKAIGQRRQTTLDSLSDAGYDTGRFAERGATNAGTIRAKDPQGNIHEAPAGTALPKGWVLQ